MPTRRAFVTGTLAAALPGIAAAEPYGAIPPLKSIAHYPLGVAVKAAALDDSDWVRMAPAHFSRLTPEWEMKMEYVLQADGSLRFDRSDRIEAFARRTGMAVHGHALVWYAEDGPWFQRLGQGKPDTFLNAYVAYIQSVVGRYKGAFSGWDVVNEPVSADGAGLRDCLWRKLLGDDYIGLALTAAHEADPAAVLFINDYDLEMKPAKRRTFLKLCETLLKTGAPLHGVGTQTHVPADIAPGMIRTALADIASLGLKVHVSEIDISTLHNRPGNVAQPSIDQIRTLREIVSAYHDIPAAQRYGLTFWGLRDSDSWLNGPREGKGFDEPLLFDRLYRPKPVAQALAAALR